LCAESHRLNIVAHHPENVTHFSELDGPTLPARFTATVTLVLVRSNSGGIPQVTDVAATTSGRTIVFSWSDPGIAADDSYQVTTSDGKSSIQSATQFPVDAKAGDRVCITVAVNRAGKVGPSSSEKCVTFSG
jgi:hypothetical protein